MNVGPQDLLVVRLPALLVPHSASLSPAMPLVLSAPVPVSAPPTSLDVCFFFIYLVSDFLAVRISVSSGCARRHSVSTYAAILVLSKIPSSYLSSNLFLFLLPSFLPSIHSFSIPFSPPSLLLFFVFLLSPFPTGETIEPRELKIPDLDRVKPINVSSRPVSTGD